MPVHIGNGEVYVNDEKTQFRLCAEDSALTHSGADNEKLRFELQKAMNKSDDQKEGQGNGIYRVRINDGKGYIVYKVVGTTSTIFHYHWNYNLDDLLDAT